MNTYVLYVDVLKLGLMYGRLHADCNASGKSGRNRDTANKSVPKFEVLYVPAAHVTGMLRKRQSGIIERRAF